MFHGKRSPKSTVGECQTQRGEEIDQNGYAMLPNGWREERQDKNKLRRQAYFICLVRRSHAKAEMLGVIKSHLYGRRDESCGVVRSGGGVEV